MIEVYICPKNHYVSFLKDKLTGDVVVYPEIEVAYYDWHTFYMNEKDKFTTVVTQSSEFIKFLRTCKIECKVNMLQDSDMLVDSFTEVSLKEASMALLGCYEMLSFQSKIFD